MSIRVGYLGLGSNVGDRAAHLRAAVAALREHGVEVEAISSLYETEPVGEILDQPDFLNAAVRIRTELEPEDLLDLCKAIEVEQGRMLGGQRHGPRPLDLDLLLLGDLELETDRLTLPHPQVTSRRFVLEPLLELDPELALPDGTRACGGAGGARARPGGRAGGPSEERARRSPLAAARKRLEPGGGSTGGAWPGKSGMARSAICPAGRSSIAGRRSSSVIARRRLAAIWRSAAFGGSPPEHALRDPVVHPLELARERRQVGADRLVVGAVHSSGGGDDRCGGPDGEPDRHPELGALGVAAKRRAIALQRVPEDPAHGRLKDLVAPALGVLDRDPLVGVGRIERRLGSDAVELAPDLARPVSFRPSIFSDGTVFEGKRRARRAPREITGIRSTRL